MQSKEFKVKQLETVFSKISEGFAYCKIILDDKEKPVDWVYLAVNDAYERINGVKKEVVVGKKATEILPKIRNDPADWITLYGQVALTGESIVTERYAEVRDRWYHVSAYSPQKGYFFSIFEDITERKKAEAALRESQQRWATTLSSIGDAVIATDTEGKITFMNPVAEELTGWKLSEAKEKPLKQVFKIINQHTRQEVVSPVIRVLEKGLIVGLANHTLLVRKDAMEIPIDDSGSPIRGEDGKIKGVVLVFRDITERKIAEEAIQRQAALIDLSPDAIIVKSFDDVISFWSKGAERLYGWTKEETIGKTTLELLQTKSCEPSDKIKRKLKTENHWSGELVHKTKNGKEVTVQSCWLAEQTDHGEIKSILESNVDLTERKKAEKEIVRLASFPTLNPNPVMEVNMEGKITYANPATKSLFPDLEKEGLKHVFFSDWENVKKSFGDKTADTYGRELKIGTHWYHQQFFLVPQTQQIRVYLTDVDELKQTEQAHQKTQAKLEENAVLMKKYADKMEEIAEQRAQQLKNVERMAAIGQTAGMVGHDIRNPLQAITNDMYLIAEEVKALTDGDGKQAILESVDSINENISYINKIVSDLQDYTRPLKPNIQDVNLSELIQSTIITINAPKQIEILTDLNENAKLIRTDVAYLRRIITNLLTNGIQAISEEGKLSIQTNKKHDALTISIEDSGVGIPEEVKTKMFTPLFTTKSKGQGLGLAVVKRLVEALNGTITFESTENEGTKFIIKLPQ